MLLSIKQGAEPHHQNLYNPPTEEKETKTETKKVRLTFYINKEQNELEKRAFTWKVPDLSSMTWSCWLSS